MVAAVFVVGAVYAGEPARWQAEWEQTLSAAKKEGEISFYGSQGYEKVFEVFQKRYPEIKVTSNTVRRGSEHGQAVMSERRAGKYIVDLFINGVVTPVQVFLKAKWKGKIVTYDVSRVSTVAHSLRFLYNHPDLGVEFVRRFFGEMDLVYSRDERQMVDWLGAGKYPLAFFVSDIEDAAK